MHLNFDEDQLEESVFVEKFRIQDRAEPYKRPDQRTSHRPSARNDRFSLSFANDVSLVVQEEARADEKQESVVRMN